ncbi:MAG: PQQ-like beta-propeller repeat protein [Bacteroidetes bacterium]|nr:PQQ-like beta-propeller repeat protein [Bacteroidota bacterium]
MNQLLPYLVLFTVSFGCSDKQIPFPKINTDNVITADTINRFQLVWANELNTPLICRSVFVYEKGVVFFTQEAKSNARDKIIAFDKNTGDTLWMWSEGPYYTNHRYIRDNILYFSAGTSVYAIDCNTGGTMWKYSPPDHLAYMTLHVDENHIFVSYQNRKVNPVENESILFELNITGQANKVLTVFAKERDGFTFNFDHITVLQNLGPEVIIFCESRSWHYGSANEGRAEYVAFNLTQQTIHKDWGNIFNDIDIGGKSLLANNDLFVSSGWNQVASINTLTETINWHIAFSPGEETSGLMPVHYFNGSLFLSLGNFGRLHILKASSGATVKRIEDIGTEWYATAFITYKELAWFTTTSGLYAIDVNGKLHASLLNSDKIGNSSGNFTNGFAIDRTTGFMYTLKGSSFLCFKWA